MLQCRTWEKIRAGATCYKRREPEKSVLYRIVASGRDRLPVVWATKFEKDYGPLRNEVLQTFNEYLNCGLLEHGAARVYCDCCRHSFLVAFSCQMRGVCPACAAKRAIKFAEHLYDEVLEEVEHRHIVATIPKRLRRFFRRNRKLLGILFAALWESVLEVLVPPGSRPGLVDTVQTFGEALNFNPHTHGIVSNGAWTDDGSFAPFTDLTPETHEKLTRRFAEKVLAALQGRSLIAAEDTAQILSQEHTGFSVWLGEPFNDKQRELFVARYIERGPIAFDKLSVQDDAVVYTTKDGTAHTYDVLEFLALLSAQVPNCKESVTRYYGRYASRTRGEQAKKERAASAASAVVLPSAGEPFEEIKKPSYRWADCMKRFYEIDPLACPKCGSQMRIIAFLTDHHEIAKIMKSQGIAKAQAPPSLPLPKLPALDSHDYPLSDLDHL